MKMIITANKNENRRSLKITTTRGRKQQLTG
jgi:hypothetical protein